MGTEIKLHPSFFVFWAVFCLLDQEGYLKYFVAAAGLHELGHAAAVYLCGGRVICLRLAGPGACMEVVHPRGYQGDFVIAAGGPATGAIAALVSAALGWTTFCGANTLLTVLNCLPILPLDGGCMMASLLCMTPLGIRGEDMLRAFSRIGALFVALAGLAVLWQTRSNAALLVIGMILLFGKDGVPCKLRRDCV